MVIINKGVVNSQVMGWQSIRIDIIVNMWSTAALKAGSRPCRSLYILKLTIQ